MSEKPPNPAKMLDFYTSVFFYPICCRHIAGTPVLLIPTYPVLLDGRAVITQGDPGGVGPELGQAQDGQIFVVQAVVVGDHLLHLLHHRQDPWLPLVRAVGCGKGEPSLVHGGTLRARDTGPAPGCPTTLTPAGPRCPPVPPSGRALAAAR